MADYSNYDWQMVMLTPEMGGVFFVWMPVGQDSEEFE